MKKQYKEMYAQRKTPQIINCQKQIIISIEGVGNPNTSELFSKHIETLYKLSYGFRMSYKKDAIEGYYNYVHHLKVSGQRQIILYMMEIRII